MNAVTGQPLWTMHNPIQKQYPYLTHDLQCDLAVIGAGITGALCAYFFTQAGIETAIFDKSIAGFGSTAASTSILQYEIDTDLRGLQGLIGQRGAVDCFKLCREGVYEIARISGDIGGDCGFNYRDCLYYTDNSGDVAAFQKEYHLRQEAGFEVEYLDTQSAAERFSLPILAGIYSRGASGEIDPYRFTAELLKTSSQRGLHVYENTGIAEIHPGPEKVRLITDHGFLITARCVVFATGYEARMRIAKKIATMTRSFTIATKPVSSFAGWYNRCIIRNNESAYTYLRTTQDDRIIIGGEDMDLGGARSKMSRLKNDDPSALEKFHILEERLRKFFPDIPGIITDCTFSAFFGDTNDGLPYVGEYPEGSNLYYCLGYGSNGIIYAVLGGVFLRDLFLGKPRQELNYFRFDR